jgi:hypothetical protein
VTKEQRTLIEPKDILALELECKGCGTRVACKIGKVQPDRFLKPCPNCKTDLIRPEEDGPDFSRLANFIEALNRLVQAESRAIIRLELAEPLP